MRASVYLLIPLLLFMLLVDIYTYRGIKPLIARIKYSFARHTLTALFWGISVFIFAAFTTFMFGIKHVQKSEAYIYSGYLVAGFALFYFPKFIFIFFVLIKDIQGAIRRTISWFRERKNKSVPQFNSKRKMERSEFLYQMGLILAAIPFASILYGVTKGKFNYRVMRERISFNNLPKAFKGLKIVQISDMHLGSFNKNFEKVEKAVELINEQEPDLIVFTGDLVNNFAEETDGWAPVLGKMKAKIGKYSILGNHDYGDYSYWRSEEDKAKNLAAIKHFHKQMGFRLLLNETETINIKGEEIALVGVENWGKPPFPQHGDLNKATEGKEHLPFKILLSHDPSHWDEEVIKNSDIDLTFAGHTHGMQFGIERAGIKWSPVQYKYPRWGGLYREGDQYLYVNRGFGYIGFPGRIGMPPEITVVELA
ncbi:metallophosphoesterase [Marinifilum caeruleilacunae]|uniref:Metallophosphoesterase n=1 Tax=Marinifilum caeruleilacunae TaxID=2499076 RepID=A0ABX1WXA7_9BACT|nr:metallophosphoesterase [Marinifilum caeruleilacunae]NOU60636.1 metallophosphoesterase [Marinifilum caeruleilacunae]